MLDTQLQHGLYQLLTKAGARPEVACSSARKLTAHIRDNALPVAAVASAMYHGQLQPARATLGASPLTSQVAQIGATWAARAGTTAALTAAGATWGSVVPVIGTIIGAAAGYLVGKLFGHADYAAISRDVAKRLQIAELYKTVAGTIPGRVITQQDLEQVWYGLLHEGIFPKNWGGGTCNVQACIAGQRNSQGQCPNCGGVEQWVPPIFSSSSPPGGVKLQSAPGAIAAAVAQGVTDPRAIADQFMIPAWAGPDGGKFNVKWIYPPSTTNPGLVRQLIIDTIDALEAQGNPNLPVYYGSVPQTTVASAPPAAAQVVAPQVIAPAMVTGGGAVSLPAQSTMYIPPAVTNAAATTVQSAIASGVLPPQAAVTSSTPAPVAAGVSSDTTAALLAAMLAQQGVSMNSPQAQQLVSQAASTGVIPTPQGPPPASSVAPSIPWAAIAAGGAGLLLLAH